jgi:hypothetical protein
MFKAGTVKRPPAHPDLFAARGDVTRRPTGGARLVPQFLESLHGRGWVSAAALASELHVDLRKLRDAAHESGGRIISGQRGYSLTWTSSVEDVYAFTKRMYSQAREMRTRAMEVERIRHGRVSGEAA